MASGNGKRPNEGQGESADSGAKPTFKFPAFYLEEWSKPGASLPKIIQKDASELARAQEEIKRWQQLPERERRKMLREERRNRQSTLAQLKQDGLQGVAEAQQQQRELEKEKASLMQELSEGCGEARRRELKHKLTAVEGRIQNAKKEEEIGQSNVNASERYLHTLSHQQDEESRKYINEAMQRGYVNARIIKSVFTGPPGVGKTSLKFLLLGKPPPGLRNSTPCAERPVRVRVVSGTRIQLMDGGWKLVDEEELLQMLAGSIPIICDSLPEGEVIPVELIESLHQLHTQEEATRDQKCAASQLDQTTPSMPLPSTSAEAPLLATTDLLNQLRKAMSSRGRNVSRELIDSDWIHIIDSGGQPQFHDVLPIFIRNTCSTIFVQRLSESLNDHPIVEYFKAGERVGTPYPSPLTNIEILKCMIRTMHSQPTEGRNSMIAVVGTHIDKEHECLSQTWAEKNKILFDLLHPLFPGHLALSNEGLNEPIFPVNTENPGEEEVRIAMRLREAIESSAPDPIRIPIMWYILEMLLRRMATRLGRRVLGTEECLEIAHKLKISTEAFHAALGYFDELNICLYYPAVLPNVLFTDPQIPVDIFSELVEHRYKLLKAKEGHGNRAISKAFVTNDWLKFRDQGVVTLKFLQRFPEHYVPGLFTAADLLKLLQHLLIIAPISEDEYFMPSLLEMVSHEEVDEHRFCTDTVAPLLVRFPNGWPRAGVFPCLAVFLISHCRWEVLLPSSETPILIARNVIKFRLPRCPCTVTIVDSFAHFEVHVRAPSSVCRKICPTIRDTIFKGIDAAHATLRYTNAKPHEAFFCPHSSSDNGQTTSNQPAPPLHVATLSEDQEYWLCSKDADRFGVLTERERVWLKAETATSECQMKSPQRANAAVHASTPPLLPQSDVDSLSEQVQGSPLLQPTTQTAYGYQQPYALSLPYQPWYSHQVSPQPQFQGVSKPTEKQLMEQLYHTVANKWQPIATYLDIPQAQLSAVDERYRGDPQKCLMAVLTEKWLPRVSPLPTWQELANAIEFVGRPDIAQILRQLYCYPMPPMLNPHYPSESHRMRPGTHVPHAQHQYAEQTPMQLQTPPPKRFHPMPQQTQVLYPQHVYTQQQSVASTHLPVFPPPLPHQHALYHPSRPGHGLQTPGYPMPPMLNPHYPSESHRMPQGTHVPHLQHQYAEQTPILHVELYTDSHSKTFSPYATRDTSFVPPACIHSTAICCTHTAPSLPSSSSPSACPLSPLPTWLWTTNSRG